MAVFWVATLVAMCWHETAHGHATKHYGGKVPAMGFLLIYLAPAFYTDTTEGMVTGSRYQRFIIAMAGSWSEFYLSAFATIIWWDSAPNTPVHNAAYVMMLVTGFAAALINLNPLIKLDGYYMMCEAIGLNELKEDSTAYVSGWIKRHIWDLPVEVPYVPRRRRFGYVVYALLSGVYSYTMLYILARFVGNVFRNFDPDWSFIPELVTAAFIFRSRIRSLVTFMKLVYLDKRDRVRSWAIFRHPLYLLGALLLFACLPLWHDTIHGRFVLEPQHRVFVRALVPGIGHAGLRCRRHAGRRGCAVASNEQSRPPLEPGQDRSRLRCRPVCARRPRSCTTPITAPQLRTATASPNRCARSMPRLRLSTSPARSRASCSPRG